MARNHVLRILAMIIPGVSGGGEYYPHVSLVLDILYPC